jgi:predicted anti-sigma-YlaC factor YlaD
MMNCSKAHKLISPYIDGELPGRDIKTLEDHIKVCPKCRAEFEENKELHNLFADDDRFKAPYGFHTRVMANIRSGKTRGISEIPVFARLAEAFVIIMVIAFGVLSGSLFMGGSMPDKTGEVMASLSLDVFDSAPPGSLGGVYLAMTEVRNEK